MTRENNEIVDAIKARPDIKDYYGNLPIYNSLMKNDVDMVRRLFKKGRDYFNLRNYKHESIFHVAARSNAVESLEVLIDEQIFTEELLKKNYKGDTPMHIAAKKQNTSILEI